MKPSQEARSPRSRADDAGAGAQSDPETETESESEQPSTKREGSEQGVQLITSSGEITVMNLLLLS